MENIKIEFLHLMVHESALKRSYETKINKVGITLTLKHADN